MSLDDRIDIRAGKISHMLVSCAYHAPEVTSRRTKYHVSKIFISSYLYLLHYKFLDLFRTLTDKKKGQFEHNICASLCLSRFHKYIY